MTTAEQIAYIRVILGGMPTSTAPDEVITLFLNKWSTYYDLSNNADKEWLVIYNATVDTLRWLIAKAGVTAGSNASSIREKRGQEEKEIRYSEGASVLQGYQDLLDYLLKNPDYISPTLSVGFNALVVGGVSQEEYDRVRSDSDSLHDTLEIGWQYKSAYQGGNESKTWNQPRLYENEGF